MSVCNLCPRGCNKDRATERGFCNAGASLTLARAGLHFWEEPCISTYGGSGAVFFSGCTLKCIYCQNDKISRGHTGKEITEKRLREIFDELIDQGADNINLVTPSHYADKIAEALSKEKLPVPVVYNTSAYEKAETLKMLDGLVDVYLPDYKYASSDLAKRLSFAPDYPETAFAAIEEMFRQRGSYTLDEDGLLTSGVLIRHLVLPGFIENTLDVIDRITSRFDDTQVLFSLMSQYTPPKKELSIPSLNRRLTEEEYSRAVDYLYLSGFENGFVQELSSAKEEYTPDFDLSGV
ncbi:MAG: radical SAM protein [Clostridia bacterium]|nr:radical SAM protein [Clostridia bacterium]